HREDEVAGGAGEGEQAAVIAREELADDVLDVAAGAEGAAAAGDEDGAHAGLGVELLEGLTQLGVDLEGERIEAVGAGERDRGDAGRLVEGEAEGVELQRHRCESPRWIGARLYGTAAVASISTLAPGASRPLTSMSAIAG